MSMTDMTGAFDEIPEDIVKSVLGHAGFQDTADQITSTEEESPVAASEEVPQETEEEVPPPSAPGGPLFTDEEDESDIVTLSDGSKYPLQLVEEWAKQANAPLPPITEPPQETPTPPPLNLPIVTPEDLQDAGPAVQALLMIANAQAQQMKDFREQLEKTRVVQQQVSESEASKIYSAATSAFKQAHNLPEDLMKKIEDNASVDDFHRYMRTDKNPFEATQYSLLRSYWDLPEARQYEFERQHDNRNAAQTRKQKLAGVSGGHGPTSRGAPVYDENTQEGRYAAAVEMVRQDMFGDQG